MAIATSINKGRTYSSNPSVALIQNYADIMQNLIDQHFHVLGNAPDVLFIMMATMGAESSYNLYHNNGTTPNHIQINQYRSSIGKSYWNDPVIVPIRDSVSSTVRTNVLEGLSAKALMASMGMYQVRSCRESMALMGDGYTGIAERYNLLVNPGESITATYPNNDTGATRSMVMGCIVMETKYKRRLRQHDPSTAMFYAVGDYLGKAGARDILGTTPEMRVALINDPKTRIAQKLALAGIVRGNTGRVNSNTNKSRVLVAENKTSTTPSTNLAPATGIGCSKA